VDSITKMKPHAHNGTDMLESTPDPSVSVDEKMGDSEDSDAEDGTDDRDNIGNDDEPDDDKPDNNRNDNEQEDADISEGGEHGDAGDVDKLSED